MQIPFGGSFYNLVQWCAWTEERSGKVRLQISCDVVYTKRWVPAKGIINSSSIEVGSNGFSLTVSYIVLCGLLTQEVSGATHFRLLTSHCQCLAQTATCVCILKAGMAANICCSVSNAADKCEQFEHQADLSTFVTCQCLQPDAAFNADRKAFIAWCLQLNSKG